TGLRRLERGGAARAPAIEVAGHAGDEGGELRVLVDGRLDGRLVHGEGNVARAIGREQRLAQLRADLPVRLQRIDIGQRDATVEVAVDVLPVFRRLAVDVARQVEVVAVGFDLGQRHHAGVFGHVGALAEHVDDAVDVP